MLRHMMSEGEGGSIGAALVEVDRFLSPEGVGGAGAEDAPAAGFESSPRGDCLAFFLAMVEEPFGVAQEASKILPARCKSGSCY